MKCGYCESYNFSNNHPIGIELPINIETIHRCSNGKTYRLVGLRSSKWFVIEEYKNESA